jgi:hypothetical protein
MIETKELARAAMAISDAVNIAHIVAYKFLTQNALMEELGGFVRKGACAKDIYMALMVCGRFILGL